MNSKVWLTVYGIVSLVVVGGTGFYAISSHGTYAEAMAGWESKVGSIESLERRVPYPNQENAGALGAKVDEYKSSVKALSETLKTFQRPLNKDLPNTEFQQLVKKRVEEFRAAASKGGLEIATETEFQLGFESYANSLPSPELVPLLDYELEAIDQLLRKLITNGATGLLSFGRDEIPGEGASEEAPQANVVHKYPVRVRFRAPYASVQKMVNDLANDRKFFYIVRVIKVKNQLKEGPVKLTADAGSGGFVTYQNPVTKEIASPEMLTAWGSGTAAAAEVESKAREAGFVRAEQDARVLMGLEQLEVFLVVDIARFLGPEEIEAIAPKPEAKKKGKS
jgi:hypothetical protein